MEEAETLADAKSFPVKLLRITRSTSLDISLNFINTINKKFLYVKNDYKHNKDIKAYEIFNIDDFINDIKTQDKYLICCDSKRNAELIYSLLNDSEFNKLLNYERNIDRFIDLLEIFTYIDILGYYYTKIFDHYIKFYDEISSKLKIILNLWPNKDLALKKAKHYSQEWLEWRLAGALRIFQFVETKPYLTKEFYYNKLKDSIKETDNHLLNEVNWDSLKDHYLINSYKIQLRYSLALLMILAFGNFQRMGLKINSKISYKLILFWALLSKEVKSRSVDNPSAPWKVFLMGIPHWSKIDKFFIEKINEDAIEFIILHAQHKFDEHKEEFNLYLDFKQIIH